MTKRVADFLVDVLVEAGVERVYGVSGDSLNGITDSIRTRRNIFTDLWGDAILLCLDANRKRCRFRY